jgi:mono/diheme cytochrome c family protein
MPKIVMTPKTAKFGDDAMLTEGLVHYSRNCLTCHGPFAVSSGVLPDLRWSEISADRDVWYDVVHEGTLAGNGMVAFDDVLTEDEMEAIRAYVIAQGHAYADASAAGN